MKRNRLSQDEISQSFNLKKLLGYSPSEKQKKLFYELAVDQMVQRTAGGDDVNGKKFKNYEPEYAKQKGVSVDAVDLILSGEMLNGFEQGSSKDTVKISMQSDQLGKAYGHISGMKGHPTIEKGKVRDFFGFKNEDDLKTILTVVDSAKEDFNKGKNVMSQERKTQVDLVDLREAITSITLDFGDLDG